MTRMKHITYIHKDRRSEWGFVVSGYGLLGLVVRGSGLGLVLLCLCFYHTIDLLFFFLLVIAFVFMLSLFYT